VAKIKAEMKMMESWFVLELIHLIQEAKDKVDELGTQGRLRMTVEDLIEFNQVSSRYLTLKEVFKIATGTDFVDRRR
jgi:hypothetical protein